MEAIFDNFFRYFSQNHVKASLHLAMTSDIRQQHSFTNKTTYQQMIIKQPVHLGPVVQSIISLTSSFYDFITKYTDIFVEKMREVFAIQKLLTFFQQKILAYLKY